MSSSLPSIAVYGATGHTGRFVVQQALLRGMNVVAVGRDAERLDALFSSAVVRRVAELNDARALEQAFMGCGLVVNCVGPFLDTASPVAQAALSPQSNPAQSPALPNCTLRHWPQVAW